MVKNPPASAGDIGDRAQPLGWEYPLEKEMATHPKYSYLEKKNKEYWGRLPFPLPGNLPNTEVKLHLLGFQHWQADSLPLNHLRGLMYVFLCPIVLLTFHTYPL